MEEEVEFAEKGNHIEDDGVPIIGEDPEEDPCEDEGKPIEEEDPEKDPSEEMR